MDFLLDLSKLGMGALKDIYNKTLSAGSEMEEEEKRKIEEHEKKE